VLAHQGGWDEILLVVGPMLVIVLLLRLAKHRVERLRAADPTRPAEPSEPTEPPDRRGPVPPPT
jgi:hypothetical protein